LGSTSKKISKKNGEKLTSQVKRRDFKRQIATGLNAEREGELGENSPFVFFEKRKLRGRQAI